MATVKEGEGTSRFASLLQPLRDLADNWNIDIARELEQYIDLLEGVTFTVGDGPQKLNFAEGLLLALFFAASGVLVLCCIVCFLSFVCLAALVIQGSAFVYSKKVEYLYNLVFQALEYINAHKKRDEAGGASAAHGHSSRSARVQTDNDDEMKPLDSVIDSLFSKS